MNRKKQAGFSVLQIVLVMGFAIVVGVISIQQFSGAIGQAKQKAAMAEIIKVVNAAGVFRQIERAYTAVTITKLASEGYHVEPFTTGTAQNAYGLDIAVNGTTASGDLTLSYATPNQPSCTALMKRVVGLDGYKSGADCATGTLAATFE